LNLKNLNAAITIAALVGCSTSATADKGTTDVVVADGTTPTEGDADTDTDSDSDADSDTDSDTDSDSDADADPGSATYTTRGSGS
jgi:hypothetical protein